MKALFCAYVILAVAFPASSFSPVVAVPKPWRSHCRMARYAHHGSPQHDKRSAEQVPVGPKGYLQGFFTSPIDTNVTTERGSGLEQALKLAIGTTGVLLALLVGFMASNGLL